MSRFASRLLTLEAMLLLPVARFLVGHVTLKHWRNTLGSVADKERRASAGCHGEIAMVRAHRLAHHVERAASRLPFHMKCLPKAIVLQWMLRRRGLDGRLVIAVQTRGEKSEDRYHAWVERGEDMLIGHCDRALYRPLMAIASTADPSIVQRDG